MLTTNSPVSSALVTESLRWPVPGRFEPEKHTNGGS